MRLTSDGQKMVEFLCLLTIRNVLRSCFSTRLDDSVDVFAAIFVCRFQVVQLLVKIRNIRLQLRGLRRQPILHIVQWTEHKPAP